MITEDYVSYETAKLLKEKGFNESCYTYYDYIDDTINRFDKGYHFNNTSYPWGVPYGINKAKKYVVAPTLQMTMKWLREVHDLHIMVNCVGKVNYDPIVQRFDGKDFEIEGVEIGITRCINGNWEDVRRGFKTHEQACEAAIKYCLENLI